MGYNIPEKIFDQHMHIVRDVHFDVDKYKIDELYVIKHTITNAHTIDGKMVGKLIKANAHALTFDIFTEVIPEGVLPTDPHNYYGITTITLLLDDIIEKQIEIERLLTETEAVVYVTSAIAKEGTKDIIPEPINEKPTLADKYKGDLSIYTPLLRTPRPSPIEQMILSNKSRLKSDIQAAYKINKDDAKELIENGPMKIVEDMMNNNTDDYVVILQDGEYYKRISFLNVDGSFNPEPFEELKRHSGRVRISFKNGISNINFYDSVKYLEVNSDSIILRRPEQGSTFMALSKDTCRMMFDKIEFEQIL